MSRASSPSVIYRRPSGRAGEKSLATPECFPDLHLDEILDTVVAGRDEYGLRPFFLDPLGDLESISYRQEVFRDLEQPAVREVVEAFAAAMRDMRHQLGVVEQLRVRLQRQRWFLDAAATYRSAVEGLSRSFEPLELSSSGLLSVRDHLSGYVSSQGFKTLAADVERVRDGLSQVSYCLFIRGSRIRVTSYEGEPDYEAEVAATFEKFRQGAVKDYRKDFRELADMNHVEAEVLDCVARLHPEPFAGLARFCDVHASYLDEAVAGFDREVQFYVAVLDWAERLRRAGLPTCYPEVSGTREVWARDVFDAALAGKLLQGGGRVVCNDFDLHGEESVLVVTGPNDGGKTTFARAFGQVHYLARLGCPVPARSARLALCDQIFTHFEREEHIEDLRGKLEDDLVRIRSILERATPRSIVLLNEIFSSTTFADALLLGTRVLQRLIELGALCICVTFVEEWSRLGPETVSMVSCVDPSNPARRTFRVERRQADGKAYALSIAESYGLTYDAVAKRLSS